MNIETVTSGSRTLKDAINETIRDWVTNIETSHYIIGSVVGPHPYPMIVRDFQSVIGRESRSQILEATGRLPDYAIACVGGGSNAIGLFSAFIDDDAVRLIGVEAAGLTMKMLVELIIPLPALVLILQQNWELWNTWQKRKSKQEL